MIMFFVNFSLYFARMSNSTLGTVMTVQLNTEDIPDYDPMPAMQQWYNNKHRRPNFMDKTALKKLSIPTIAKRQNEAEASGASGVTESVESVDPNNDSDSDYDSIFASDSDTDGSMSLSDEDM